VFILALLALSVFAAEGVTSDDWNEDTDVQIFESVDRENHRDDKGQQYKLKDNEQLYGSEETVTDGMPALWQNTTETRLEMQEGKLVNISIIREHRIDKHRKVQKIKTIMHNKYKIDNVLEVVRNFGAEYGKELSALELQLFNTIATTHGNDFEMQYAIKQIKKDELDKTLRKVAKMFTVHLDEDDFSYWSDMITNKCTDKYQVFALDTSKVEINRPDLWTIKTEVLMATCGSPENVGYQIFAWAASKSGSYQRNQYSGENGETIDKLVTRWLYANMHSMVDCKRDVLASACVDSETCTLSEFSTSDTKEETKLHVSSEDQWVEHADGDKGEVGHPVKQENKELPEETNPDNQMWGAGKKL